MTRPTLHIAVAGQKSKASDYNDNFDMMMDYVEDSIDGMKTWTINTVDMPVTSLESSGTISLTDMTINRLATSGDVTFVLPVITDNTRFHQILVQLELLDASDTITLGTSNYFYQIEPNFSTTGKYDIVYEYDGDNWVVGAMKKGTV